MRFHCRTLWMLRDVSNVRDLPWLDALLITNSELFTALQRRNITDLRKTNRRTPKSNRLYRYIAHIGKTWISGFLSQFSWRKFFFVLFCFYLDLDKINAGDKNHRESRSLPEPDEYEKCQFSPSWTFRSGANNSSQLQKKIVIAVLERGTDITIHTDRILFFFSLWIK